MKALVAITDQDWYEHLRALRPDEVNFWQPSAGTDFKALSIGQPLLFKLHSPNNFVAGGGFFAHFSRLPVSLAWEAFGEKNGAASLQQMRQRIARYRREADTREDYVIGCIILQDPFFLERHAWVPVPSDFSLNIVRGKGYDLSVEPGRSLWSAVEMGRAVTGQVAEPRPTPMFGEPALVRRRLGQGTFRVVVTDTYRRSCAVTGEKTLPVLEAAHIRPVAAAGAHSVNNGILLRSDIHTLFDRGYVTVTPDHRFRVSQRLRNDWQNGRVYYDLDGKSIRLPSNESDHPNRLDLEWHADSVFLR